VIEIDTVTKRYGRTVAVDGLSFTVRPGIVTGFLGPNGAGKSTTMRMIAGLDRPTAGRVLVNRRDYRRAPVPMAELGLLLEAKAVHRASARNHLLCLSQTNGIGRRRVDEVLGQVGLADVAGKRVGGFPSGWASGSGWPPRCSGTRRWSSWTSRSTGSTRRVWGGGRPGCRPRWR
jgi:ABC-2 type transport system ATP-binding protein